MTDLQAKGWALAQRMADESRIRAAVRRPPEASVIQVIEVVFRRGDGIEDDPVREVAAYYSLDGVLLAERDPR